MLKENAYRLASQNLEYLRRYKNSRALWIVNGNVVRTPNTDLDVAQMLSKGAILVGVFDGGMDRLELAEAIIAADM
jgi:hypothetical protein